MLGTRGVPAQYGGFETAVEEVGSRLVERGHEVTVYCRWGTDDTYRGMSLVHLPSVKQRSLETLSHTAVSVGHLLRSDWDAVAVFNAANAVFLPALRARRVPVALHVDGLEWRRSKWSGAGQRYYRLAESLGVRWADALIADSEAIADYYAVEFGARTTLISYGAPIITDADVQRLSDLGLDPGGYHLVVARFEPENHVAMIAAGYVSSAATLPLVIVGSAPYSDAYSAHVRDLVGGDERVHLLGGVWNQKLLDALYWGAATYLHGHSVGGTNPSLLRAMGARTATIAYDCVFNRETLGGHGWFFSTAEDVSSALVKAEATPATMDELAGAAEQRARSHYRWDDVADGYERLLLGLAAGESRRGECSGRRTGRYVLTDGDAMPSRTGYSRVP